MEECSPFAGYAVIDKAQSGYPETLMSKPIRRRMWMALAVLSVAGLLSMHGLDTVIASVDHSHAGHSSGADADPDRHGIIGLCLFVTTMTGIAVAIGAGLRRLKCPAHFADRIDNFLSPVRGRGGSGPPLRYRLCVLRL
jgi:hypothetical protein